MPSDLDGAEGGEEARPGSLLRPVRDGAEEAEGAGAAHEAALDGHRVAASREERVEGAPGAGAAEDQVAAAERDHVAAVAQAAEGEADGGERRVGAHVGEDDDAAAGALAGVAEAGAGRGVHD